MAITNVGELAVAVADFLNRDDLDSIMSTLIDNAQDRILFDPRFRGELTETVITKTRSGDDLVNPLRTDSFWDDDIGAELSDTLTVYSSDATNQDTDQEASEYLPFTESDRTIDLEIIRLYIDNTEYTRVNDYSDVLNAAPNEFIYCEVGGKYYLSGWKIEDVSDSSGDDLVTFTFIANEKVRIAEETVINEQDETEETVETSRALQQYPNMFLYATLVEAAIYLRDSEFIQVYQARYEELMDKLAKDWKRKQISTGFNVRSAPRRTS